jgi:hypothetical protein
MLCGHLERAGVIAPRSSRRCTQRGTQRATRRASSRSHDVDSCASSADTRAPHSPIDLRNENLSGRRIHQNYASRPGRCAAVVFCACANAAAGAPGAARKVTLHHPAGVGNAHRFRSIVFGLFFTMKGRYSLHAPSTARPPNSHQQSTSRGKCRGHCNACRRHCMADRAERPCPRERMDSWNGNHRNVHGRQEAPLAVHANQHGCGRASCCHAIKAATQMIQHGYGNSHIPQ